MFSKIQQNARIRQFIQKLKQNLTNISEHKESLIFTGITGSGKGTLIHYLVKNKNLYAHLSQTGDMLIRIKPQMDNLFGNITISDKMHSDTSMPVQIQYRGQVYRDLPGFMDNRDQKKEIPQDIINSFFIHQVYKKTNQLKIIFVTSKSSFNDRANQFIKSLNIFTDRFMDIQTIKKSIILIVTKANSNIEIKHIKNILINILKDLGSQIPSNSRDLLEHWVQNQSLIDLFKIPKKQGVLEYYDADRISKKIKLIQYSKSPQIKTVVCQHSNAKILQLQKKWNERINQICKQIIQSNYESYLHNIRKIQMLNTAKSNLNYMSHKLDILLKSNDPQEFRQKLKNLPQLIKAKQFSKTKKLLAQFDQYFQFLQFFTKIQRRMFKLDKWKQPLFQIQDHINHLVRQAWEEIQNKNLFIKGFIIDSETIQKKIHHHSGFTPKKVIVLAYFLIFNEDISINGVDMLIFSQYLIVEDKQVKIRLNGLNGPDHPVFTANINQNGLPGRPGKNAGNLVLKVKQKSINIHNLSADLRGGKGGKGQNGGEISTKQNTLCIKALNLDVKKQTKNKKFLMSRQDYEFAKRNILSKIGEVLRILGTYNSQVLQFYSTENDNKQKYKFTLGGAGGKPGNSGNLNVEIGDSILINITEAEKSQCGCGHIQAYQGLYVKEMVFSNFRDEGKQYNLKKQKEQQMKINQQRRVLEQIQRIKKKLPVKKALQSKSLMTNPQSSNKQEEQEAQTPFQFKKQYKSQKIQKFSQVIKEQIAQYEQDKSSKYKIVKKIQFQQPQQNEKTPMIIHRKPLNKKPMLLASTFRKPQNQRTQKELYNSRIDQSYVSRKQTTDTLNPNNIVRSRKKSFNKLTQQLKSDIQFQNNQFSNLSSKQIASEIGKQVMTQIGTDAIQNVSKRIINKIGQRIIRSGMVIQKQLFTELSKQTVQNIGKQISKQGVIEAQKKILQEFGVLTSQQLTKNIAKSSFQQVQQQVFTSLGKQIFKEGADQIQRQAFKKMTQGMAKQGLFKLGKQASKQAQIQFAHKSIGMGTGYFQGMAVGLGKSIIFQVFLSAVMASGITDGWVIKPHFVSKRLQFDDWNSKDVQDPEPLKEISQEQINEAESQYQIFMKSFIHMKDIFSNKI